MLADIPSIELLAPEDGAYSFRDESILGTRLQLLLVARNYAIARDAALAIRAEIDRLNLIFNSRRADSELSALNRLHEFRASAELFEVVVLSEQWRAATGAAFSGRLGRVLDLWRRARDEAPSPNEVRRLAHAADSAEVLLDSTTRTIVKPTAVEFALDGIAKGWIVDRAFATAMRWPGVTGALVDIGGDVRAGGDPPNSAGWTVGIADPQLPYDNAPLVATARLSNHAIATSGRGARDRIIAGRLFSPTLAPTDGWPISHRISASVIAESAADADALATAMLVLPPDRAVALANRHGAPARIEAGDSAVHWTRDAQNTSAPAHFVASEAHTTRKSVTAEGWQEGWQALATFTAPRRQLIRDPQFRSPYMAMWITDRDNRPVRTLILVGKRADWQKDNFIWWSINRDNSERLVSTRSMSTSGAGVYNVFWDGVDDTGHTVDPGTYVLHVETSRERGKHTYRSLTLDFGQFKRFVEVLPPTEEGGGLRVSFDHY